jgi:hypothetical protein
MRSKRFSLSELKFFVPSHLHTEANQHISHSRINRASLRESLSLSLSLSLCMYVCVCLCVYLVLDEFVSVQDPLAEGMASVAGAIHGWLTVSFLKKK